MSLKIKFQFDPSGGIDSEVLPAYLESTIDEAVVQDFTEVIKLTREDRETRGYKSLRIMFEMHRIPVLYERLVISDQAPVIPEKQFLFGFRPTEGLCIFTKKKAHKVMLCDGPIRELAKQCVLTQSLQYILVEPDKLEMWSYIPVCCSNESCALKTRPFGMRRDLFEEEDYCEE